MYAKIFRLLLCATLVAAPSLSHAAIGRVEFVSGAATLSSPGAPSASIQRGQSLESGQTVETASGRVQIRFSDGSMMALAPHTIFRIDDYQYNGKSDGSERGFFQLIKGGLRTVTGAIGKVNKANYRVESPTATIGIRGTHYQLRLCDGDCVNKQGSKEKDGLYAAVSRGAINLANDAGSLDVKAGKAAYVASRSTPPQSLDRVPAGASVAAAAATGDEDLVGPERAEASTEQAENALRVLANLAPNVENLSGLHEESESFLSPSGGYQAGQDVYKVDGNYVVANLDGIEIIGASDYSRISSNTGTLTELELNVKAYADSNGAIRVITNKLGSASNNTAGVYDIYHDGELFLTRWGGPGKTGGTLNATLHGNQSIHWIVGTEYQGTLPTTGSATYNMVAATQPTSTDPNAAVGTLNSASVTVNFGGNGSKYAGMPYAQYVLDSNLFHATGDAGLDTAGDFETGNAGTVRGTVTGSICGSTCSAYVHGLFAGAGVSRNNITVPNSLGLVYEIRNSATSAYHGAAGLKAQ